VCEILQWRNGFCSLPSYINVYSKNTFPKTCLLIERDDPPIERGVIDGDTPLAHHFPELPMGDRIGDILSHCP
jgi:hypothetical protein